MQDRACVSVLRAYVSQHARFRDGGLAASSSIHERPARERTLPAAIGLQRRFGKTLISRYLFIRRSAQEAAWLR